MRDEIICCVIIILLSGLFFLNGYVVKDNTQSIVNAIESAESNGKSYQKILDKWESEKRALFYFCSHGIIAEIDENITKIIDLNGHTLTVKNNNAESNYTTPVFTNNGKLIIKNGLESILLTTSKSL